MEDYVRSLSSEFNQVNPNYSSQFPCAVVAGSDSNYVVAGSRMQQESLLTKHICELGLELELGKPIPKKILLFINVDGIPLANNSSSEFWPILFRVLGYDYVFIAGVYHGYGKPNDVNQFLSAFRDEFIKIRTSGLIFEGKNIPVAMSEMSSDSPATTFMLNIATHNAYYGCRKCVTPGVWEANVSTVTMTKKGGCVTYPDVNANLRTDSSFRNRLQIKHHNKDGIRSIAEDLFTDVIKDVVIMHCVYIGVHKKIVGIWFKDPFDKIRLNKEQLLHISAFRVAVGRYMPFDFARKTRPVKDFPMWKATELKFDLNYLGPVSYKKF